VSKLDQILQNRTEGAAAIEVATISLIRKHLNAPRPSVRQLLSDLKRIRSRFAQMANIIKLCDFIVCNLATNQIGEFENKLNKYQSSNERNRRETVLKASKTIMRYASIFTFSNSTTVRDAVFLAAKSGWRGRVLVTEGRPKKEGTLLAKKLAAAGIDVTLSVDAFMPHLIKTSDVIFIGADCITERYFVNKIGSGMVVESAAKHKKPVFVVADSSKVVSHRVYRFIPDENPSHEITSIKANSMKVLNRYFETVIPLGKFSYICGRRLVMPDDFGKLV